MRNNGNAQFILLNRFTAWFILFSFATHFSCMIHSKKKECMPTQTTARLLCIHSVLSNSALLLHIYGKRIYLLIGFMDCENRWTVEYLHLYPKCCGKPILNGLVLTRSIHKASEGIIFCLDLNLFCFRIMFCMLRGRVIDIVVF